VIFIMRCYDFRFGLFSVHAVNLASISPFSLTDVTAYESNERPHWQRKLPTHSRQAGLGTESIPQSTIANEFGLSDISNDRAQQMSRNREMEPVTQSTCHSRIPVNSGKFFSALSVIGALLMVELDVNFKQLPSSV